MRPYATSVWGLTLLVYEDLNRASNQLVLAPGLMSLINRLVDELINELVDALTFLTKN